jgi:ABC-type antimicrobial peptide transport system permease subunit
VDPNVPLITATTQRLSMDERFTQERFFARAGAIFGGLALLVSSIGLFGLMSYSVARRTNEVGVRMALGAAGGDVVRLVMRESMTLVLAGLALGLAGAVAESRVMSSLLFGLAPVDPVAIAGAMIAMTTLAALAGYLPARRAARVDPMVALRDE